MPGADSNILNCLQSFGLHWDGDVDYQSRHIDDYEAVVRALREQQFLYPCVCSRRTLAGSSLIYQGNCRDHPQSTGISHALRVRTSDTSIQFSDALQGDINHNIANEHGDFIVKRKDGIIAYQLACVIDDHRQQVNHVVRGLDLLESTPKQLFLQHLLGYPSPEFMHIPLIVDQSGNKLSKQTRAEAVDFRQAGPILWRLLALLQQDPPPDLRHASVDCILEWGIAHWHPEHLKIASQLVPACP